MTFTEIRSRRWLVAVTMISAVTLGGIIWQGAVGQDQPADDDPQAVAQARSLSRAFRSAAHKVMPTVVKIQTTIKPRTVRRRGGETSPENPFEGTPFEDFFNDRMPGYSFRHPPIPRQGVGSGVIIDRTGIILTNNHVVDGADEVVIELADGRKLKATDIKTDERTDLAVLRVEADEPLPAASLGDSDRMEIGDWVIAVGNPFELDQTVSAGIISGKGRSMRGSVLASKRATFLQTDAAINPGNSGGPLVNLDGEVIGINTAIASRNGGYQGVGFAIPANLAKWVTNQLVKTGSVQRAYLGVQIGEIDGQLSEKLGVPIGGGVVVVEVIPKSPAASAGFEEGDVIVKFAGRAVRNLRALQEVVERSAIDSQQKADIIRNGKRQTLQVVVKPLPEELGLASVPSLRRGPRGDSPAFSSNELGLEVDELTETLAERLGFDDPSGVVISGAADDGIAAQAGLREGMLILRVGNRRVNSVAEFQAAMKGQSLENGILLLIRTRGGNRFVVLKSS